MNTNLIAKIANELSLKDFQVSNVVELLFDNECTIPFVARYRKEQTGTLDEVVLRSIRDRYHYLQDLEKNKAKYLKVVEEHCHKNPALKDKLPELIAKFRACTTKQELEDLYLPFKPKRRTRAQIAKEKGLEPLCDKLLAERAAITNLVAASADYITPESSNIDASIRVADAKEALTGASDILAERINETADMRTFVRKHSFETGVLVAKKIAFKTEPTETTLTSKAQTQKKRGGKKTDASKYENYFDYEESIHATPSHRIMAVRRAEAEKILRVTIEVDDETIIDRLKTEQILNDPITDEVRSWIEAAVDDAYKRLLSPSIETEIRLHLKQTAEEEAINVFANNLKNLLLLPPIPGKVVMGVDPGLRTGSKLAVVSDTGKPLDHTTVYPSLGKPDEEKDAIAKAAIVGLVTKHKVACIAIGNGTGSREMDRFITQALKDKEIKGIKRVVVNEAGASVYSTDDIARKEFPDLDPTIRSSISIARRLQDPLAELVKIDPRSIGVGQYQHDVNVTKLKSSLEDTVESCVNKVGVNLNTASYKLLGYVSGIGQTLAQSIVEQRDKDGKFASRTHLLGVSGFGPKAFEQAAGFLRVPESPDPLDDSAVHPERYEIVHQIAEDLGKSVSEVIGQKELVSAIPFEKYVTANLGLPTLQDIAQELIKPGRDPREDGSRLMFSDDICEVEDLKIGMSLKGTVTNVTNFGAFVDIGVHQDGLVHLSELSNEFVKDTASVVSVGDILNVRIIDVDIKRRRISLSCLKEGDRPDAQAPRQQREKPKGPRRDQRPRKDQRPKRPSKPKPKKPEKHYSMDDLLSKFGKG